MNRWILSLALVAGVLIHSPLEAQRTAVPPGYEPPPGMCRIWLDGVPANRQPAPTDCATAIRRKPPNGQVIFGSRPEQRPPARQLDDRRADPERRTEPERKADPAPAVQRTDPRRGRGGERRVQTRDRRDDP